MKKFLDYKFLMSILASVVVLLEVLVKFFKLNINIEAVISITGAIVGVLMTIGVVEKKKGDKTIKTKEDLKDLIQDEETDEKDGEKTEENTKKDDANIEKKDKATIKENNNKNDE